MGNAVGEYASGCHPFTRTDVSNAGSGARRFFHALACLAAVIPCAGLSGCFLFFDPLAECEPDSAEWIRALAAPDASDFGRTIAQASNGDFLVGGFTSIGDSAYDVLLVRTDTAGNPKWRRVFGSDGESERAVRVAIAPDRDILVLATIGHAYDTFQQADYYLIRTDPSGEARWEQRFGGDYNDVAADMLLTGDGPLVLGSADMAGDGNFDLQLVQLDHDGNALWSVAYGGDGNERAIGLAPSGDGGFALLGESASTGGGDPELVLVGVDASGEQRWSQSYGAIGERDVRSIQPVPGGGFIVAGHERNTPYLLKLDGSGGVAWERRLRVDLFRTVEAVAAAPDGGFIVTGMNAGFCGSTAHLTRTDAQGNVRWTRNYAPLFGLAGGHGVIAAHDGGWVLAGDSSEYLLEGGQEQTALYLVKVNADGY